MKRKLYLSLTVFFLLVMALAACTKYERQVVPFKLPSSLPNSVQAADAIIAARSFDSKDEATAAFGFDIKGAGILPVQVMFDNRGNHSLEIVPSQTFMVDESDQVWNILDQKLAYDRLAKKTELGQVMPEGAKYGALAGLAGGVIGAAIGIVSGHNVGEAAGKGAVLGGVAGLTIGGAQGLDNQDVQAKIREDLKTRSLERRAIKPKELAHGFIFFPGEAKKGKEVRLQLRAIDTKELYSLILKL